MLTEHPSEIWTKAHIDASLYTKWWLQLPIEEKKQLRERAAERAQKELAKIIHRSGQEHNYQKEVVCVLDVTAQRLLELATDLECVIAYEKAHRRPIDISSGI